jgi:hypothetical protein
MRLFVRLLRDYETAKRRRGLIDFDDILSPGFRRYSSQNAPDRASLSTRWASGWVHEAV